MSGARTRAGRARPGARLYAKAGFKEAMRSSNVKSVHGGKDYAARPANSLRSSHAVCIFAASADRPASRKASGIAPRSFPRRSSGRAAR